MYALSGAGQSGMAGASLPGGGGAVRGRRKDVSTHPAYENAEEALALVELLAGMFNLAPRHGQKSEFAGPYFECMKAPFHGKNGHIAMQTPDLENAVAELKEKGFSFREETAAYDDAGKLKNIYLAGEYGGFAIHILRG